MLSKCTVSLKSRVFNLCSIRTIRHPTPAPVEYIDGKSKIGKAAGFAPVRVEIEKGKSYAWCTCGETSKQPFCDGAHKKLNAQLKEGELKYRPLKFVCEESRPVWFCMCRGSSNMPFCDGTHKSLKKKAESDTKFKVE